MVTEVANVVMGIGKKGLVASSLPWMPENLGPVVVVVVVVVGKVEAVRGDVGNIHGESSREKENGRSQEGREREGHHCAR